MGFTDFWHMLARVQHSRWHDVFSVPYLNGFRTQSASDEGGCPVIWGSAKAATAVMAASIPALRVLVGDIGTSSTWCCESTSFGATLRSLEHAPKRDRRPPDKTSRGGKIYDAATDQESEDKVGLSWSESGRIIKTQAACPPTYDEILPVGGGRKEEE
ncbi:hypothetical protein GGS23DRAFT_460159 [Durotheca rogersii]|uniref:uncharacterized protein n=1 Tax=Durotheca rogersii TaxID=419775 RepID=UPI0022204597|nr:uncharacterized protein GGS23DRAFT_460159 [Durotheca rogersii]KAI5864715.1 hypothetical protein GGS23DRAFT_460159 [Durotheca rogersii]